jgi:hypothetical protein
MKPLKIGVLSDKAEIQGLVNTGIFRDGTSQTSAPKTLLLGSYVEIPVL